MKVTIDIPNFDGEGVDVIWDKNANYEIMVEGDEVIIRANKEALMSIAKQMIYLAQDDMPPYAHIHYNAFFTGEVVSKYDLGIEKDSI